MLQPAKEFSIGRPQIIAGLMLLGFLAQCVWTAARRQLSDLEIQYITSGQSRETGQLLRRNSPLTCWIAALPTRGVASARRVLPGSMTMSLAIPRPWLMRLPFVGFGVWLGGALWWVARRLFDDAGGYVALALYCSSPAMVMTGSNVGPEIILAWSIFGLVYTAIGVAHTLYAPARKWIPRVLILGLASGFALATALWSYTLVVLAMAMMFYLAPNRRRAVLAVWLGAVVVDGAVLGYFVWWAGDATTSPDFFLYPRLIPERPWDLWFPLADGYVMAGFFIAALVVYASWNRARYFGNTAPLLTGFLTVLLFTLVPAIRIWDAPLGLSFAFVFIGGIAADLLETAHRQAASISLGAGLVLRTVLSMNTLGRWIHQNRV